MARLRPFFPKNDSKLRVVDRWIGHAEDTLQSLKAI